MRKAKGMPRVAVRPESETEAWAWKEFFPRDSRGSMALPTP